MRSAGFYRVTVKGGGRFVYDTIDVGRFALAMAEARDDRPFTVKPLCECPDLLCQIAQGRDVDMEAMKAELRAAGIPVE